jgi:TQXA domain-containing protein
MTLSGNLVGEGQSVDGFAPLPDNSAFDPVADGYPSSNPDTGFEREDEWFGGIIHGTPASGGQTLNLYCIDLHTETTSGYGYNLGDWSDAAVPNVGYVARILNENYPNNPDEPALSSINEKAAAVQAAIWFFTDRYVLSTTDPLHDAVEALVTAVIKPAR